MTNTQKDLKKSEAIEHLKKLLKPTDTVYTVLRHVSGSGMTRDITAIAIIINERTGKAMPLNISYYVADALGWTFKDDNSAVRVGGCGMDMGFHLVYTLASVLFRDDMENDAGYSLNQKWL